MIFLANLWSPEALILFNAGCFRTSKLAYINKVDGRKAQKAHSVYNNDRDMYRKMAEPQLNVDPGWLKQTHTQKKTTP